jgi:hypothetical protein
MTAERDDRVPVVLGAGEAIVPASTAGGAGSSNTVHFNGGAIISGGGGGGGQFAVVGMVHGSITAAPGIPYGFIFSSASIVGHGVGGGGGVWRYDDQVTDCDGYRLRVVPASW